MTARIDPDAREIRGVATMGEVEQVADLYGKAFHGYGHHYRNHIDLMTKRVPREQWRLSRTLWAPDGTPLALIRVCDRTMRLGSVMLRVGGIGDVCTHPFHREAGLMRRLFEHVVPFMGDEGYDLSILWGIPRFYDKFGYIVALSGGTLQFPRGQVARLTGPYHGRKPRRSDAAGIGRLFREDLAVRDGAMVREGRWWLERVLREKGVRVLADARGRLRAYYWAGPDGDALVLREVSLGGRPDAGAVRSVIADMVKVAKRLEKPNLRFELPPEHPIGRFAVAEGCEIRRYIGHRGGGMARITNLESLCCRMAPEWGRLLAASPMAGWTGRLRVRTDMGTVDLPIERGTVEAQPPKGRTPAVLSATQDRLCRLLLGFHPVEAAVMLGEVRLSKAALPLAEALFPPRALTIFPADRF